MIRSPGLAAAALGDRILALVPSGVPVRRLESGEAPSTAEGALHMSLSEMYLRFSQEALRERDLLCVIATIGEGAAGSRALADLYTLSGDDLRSRAAVVPTGTVIGEMALAPFENGVAQIAVCLFAWPRLRRIGRVVEAIQSLAAAAGYLHEADGAGALLSRIVDRLEMLARHPGVSTRLGGVHQPGTGAHYALLSPPGSDGRPGDPKPGDGMDYHVRNGRLCVGPSRETASPWRGGEFLLLSIGPARGATDANRIDQLRRQHALVTAGAGHEEGEAATTYQSKLARLRLVNRLAARYGARSAQRTLAVTPVSLTVAPELADEVMQNGVISADFASNVQMMRDGLKYELGCDFPGVRISLSADHPAGAYGIWLDELQLVTGSLRRDRIFCNATVERLRLLDIEGEEAINPANGNRGSWVPREQVATVEAAGLTTWKPGGYLVLHMSAVLRKNAASFATIQAVAELLRSNRKYGNVLSAPAKLPRFTDVIRGLLEDEAPIHEMEVICRRYLEVEERPTWEILEEIRAVTIVLASTWWNRPDIPIYRLGPKFISSMDEGIRISGEATVLALLPELTQKMLSAVRSEVENLPPTATNPILFCEDWRMRPFVRKLVELEFPHLRVSSRRECGDPDARTVVGTIELED